MKPRYDQITLNRPIVLFIKVGTPTYKEFDEELGGTILTFEEIEKEIHPNFFDGNEYTPTLKKIKVWILRDDFGEVFEIPYDDITDIQYL